MRGMSARRPVSRVLFVPQASLDTRRSFLWDTHCCVPRATNPGDEAKDLWPLPEEYDPSPLFGLAPGGVCPAAAVTGSAVRSYRTVSPLPAGIVPVARGRVLAVCFLWHFP
jgi:hypothetical protein